MPFCEAKRDLLTTKHGARPTTVAANYGDEYVGWLYQQDFFNAKQAKKLWHYGYFTNKKRNFARRGLHW